jgi:hypothetical protein
MINNSTNINKMSLSPYEEFEDTIGVIGIRKSIYWIIYLLCLTPLSVTFQQCHGDQF